MNIDFSSWNKNKKRWRKIGQITWRGVEEERTWCDFLFSSLLTKELPIFISIFRQLKEMKWNSKKLFTQQKKRYKLFILFAPFFISSINWVEKQQHHKNLFVYLYTHSILLRKQNDSSLGWINICFNSFILFYFIFLSSYYGKTT